ncbi:MAG: CIA30 family protein [Oscillospiraceae bacterium]|nr:CIA30 family protein [Oscillospiraceae bacterium]
MKRVLYLLLAFIMLFSATICEISFAVQDDPALDEYDKLRIKWQNLAMGGEYDENNPQIKVLLNTINSVAADLLARINKNPEPGAGPNDYLWTEYMLGNRGNPSPDSDKLQFTMRSVKNMAMAYQTKGCGLYHNDELKTEILRAMDYLYVNHFKPGVDSSPRYGNWFTWEIGGPIYLSEATLYMFDFLTEQQIQDYAGTARKGTGETVDTGANALWRNRVRLLTAILRKNNDDLVRIKDAVPSHMGYTTSGDGYHADGTFMQHTYIVYNGGYGKEALSDISHFLYLLEGSPWEITDARKENVYKFIYDHYAPFMYKSVFMDMTRGREITRTDTTDAFAGITIALSVGLISEFAPAQDAANFRGMIKDWMSNDYAMKILGQGAGVAWYMFPVYNFSKILEILADDSVEPYTFKESRQFGYGVRTVHATDKFTFALAMYNSSRIQNNETGDSNTRGYYTGTGTYWIYTPDIGQFTLSKPTMNWYRFPGTTVVRNRNASFARNAYAFAGGTTLDKKYSTSGVEIGHTQLQVHAKKSWFMFDNEVVCLGSDITSTNTTEPVETTIEQRRIENNNDLIIDGVKQPATLGWSENFTGAKWAFLEGNAEGSNIGVYFPTEQTITAVRQTQSGRWTDHGTYNIDNTLYSDDYVTLFFDHGVRPENTSYSYVLLPGATAEEVAAYANNSDIEIIRQDNNIHAVYQKSLNIVGANFFTNGVQSIDAMGCSDYLTVDRASTVMISENDGKLSIALTDTTQATTGYTNVTINRSALGVLSKDPRVEVVSCYPSIVLRINTGGAVGASIETVLATDVYRNVALRRAAYHSSIPASNYNNTGHLVTDGIIDSATNFASNWTSRGSSNESVYIDLGAASKIDKVVTYWGANYARTYDIQVSNDAKSWVTIASNDAGAGGITTDTFDETTARYVRLFAKTSSGTNFIVKEIEVYGVNYLTYSVGDLPAPLADGTQYLRGGAWKVQKASEVTATGAELTAGFYDDSSWLPATVPGTVLTSYLKAGALPDPNISDQQLQISDSFFTADYWYRDSFVIPASREGHKVWLNFDAINWKADIYFNGENIGRIDGAFLRGKFDVTRLVNYGEENYLAVYIIRNANPGNVTVQTESSAGGNGGTLGQDNPTIHASIGWDWVPTIRGRNIGIYQDVFITYDQDVQLLDPWAVTKLDLVNKDFSTADIFIKTDVKNTTEAVVEAIISGTIQPGNLSFSKTVELAAGESKSVDFDKLIMDNPALWWPNTYGDQPLYTADLSLAVAGVQLDHKSFKFGVREYSYDPGSTTTRLTIYCNGTRVEGRGGNWGMDDSNLAATDEDYDIKVRLHAEANLTMIRNWVGMTHGRAFYDACDKYGIMIWDDFWLANPSDGPVPNDNAMFLNNAQDKIKRNRYHAALALYCGRNEGNPPTALNTGLINYTTSLDGTRIYIPHSATMPVSGNGPYTVQDPVYYFGAAPMTLHSERGLPNIPALESMKAMLTPDHYWPRDVVWGIHDFTTGSAQNGNKFMTEMRRYADFNSLEEFVRIAQMVNYDNHKALFAATLAAQGNGMLMWMSQSAWPSMVWQTYDYYYDTNAGYFGLKHGNQPINAIWDPRNDDLILINATPNAHEGLQAVVEVFDIGGVLTRKDTFTADIEADGKVIVGKVKFPAYTTDIKFVRTYVFDKDGAQIAEDFSWTNTKTYQNYAALNRMPKTFVKAEVQELETVSGIVTAKVLLSNDTLTPALMVRLKTLIGSTDELVLPVYYDDNYVSLMPGESKVISLEFDAKRLNGEAANFAVEGWNLYGGRIGETPEMFVEEVVQRDGLTAENVESGTYTLTANVYFAEAAPSLMPIIAIYNGERLFGYADAEDYTLTDGVYTFKTGPIDLPDGDLSVYKIKTFLWDKDYIPLRMPNQLGDYVVDWVKLPDLQPKKSYIVEGFDYANSAELTSTYTNNSSATSQSFELIDAGGVTVNGKAARLNYSISASGYAGRYRAFSGNWSAFDHYCLWIKGDARRGDVILQLNADWEVHLNTFNGENGLPYFNQTSLEWQYLEIPFSEFKHRNYPTNSTPLNSAQVTSIAFYVNGNSTSGAISGGQLCYGDVSVKAKNKPFSTLDFVPIDRQNGIVNTPFTFTVSTKLADGDGVYSDPSYGQVMYDVEDAPAGITIDANGVVSVNVAIVGKYIITIVATYNGTVYRTTVPVRIAAS